MKKIDQSIFRAYDIRGVYPNQLNEELAYKIGRAFIIYSQAKKVVVGRDMRVNSPQISQAIIRGITDQGADVEDIGLASTCTFNFALNKYKYDGGIIVTASHNPKEWVGAKLFGPKNKQISGIKGMDKLKELVMKNDFTDVKKGQTVKKEVLSKYVKFTLNLIDREKIKPFKVVLDPGNGMATNYLEAVLKFISVKPVKLYFGLDGNFPNHEPNPIKPENTKLAQQAVIEQKADCGFSFDGDADRLILIDEKGQRVGNDITLAIVARWLLKKHPGSAIVKQIVCSQTVDEVVAKAGGKTIISKVGTAFIKDSMKKNDAIFAGEISGHFFFKDFWNFDSGLLMFLLILQVLSENDKKPSEIIAEIDHHFRSEEINSEVEDQQAKMEEIKEKYSDGKIDLLDGVTVYYKDWWFNVRPSNTEPLLRLNVEAETKDLMEEKTDQLLKIIRSK